MKEIFLIYLLILLSHNLAWTQENSPWFEAMLMESKAIKSVLSNPDHEAQIIYTQINRDSFNRPSFEEFTYNLNDSTYFYPASTVKMPVALLALELLNKKGIPRSARLELDSVRYPQSFLRTDSLAPNGIPTIEHFVKQVFLMSDDFAYNKLFEMLGSQYINTALRRKGIYHSRVIHRLSDSRFGRFENRYANPTKLFEKKNQVFNRSELVDSFYWDSANSFLDGLLKGIGYYQHGELINRPFDFSCKNYLNLSHSTQIIKAVFFPDKMEQWRNYLLTQEDYDLVRKYMGYFPNEPREYQYDEPDGYVKFFLFGGKDDHLIGNIRVFNKVGWAYGYLTDIAYIVDFDKKIEFMLSAVIHVNKDKNIQ